jgi:hypothetical protein
MRNSTLKAVTASLAAVAMIVSLGASPVLARGGSGGGGHGGAGFGAGGFGGGGHFGGDLPGGGGFHAGGGFHPGGGFYAGRQMSGGYYGGGYYGHGRNGGYYNACVPNPYNREISATRHIRGRICASGRGAPERIRCEAQASRSLRFACSRQARFVIATSEAMKRLGAADGAFVKHASHLERR